MNLSDIILNCNNYKDSDEEIYIVFVKKINNKFMSNSDAVILKISISDLEELKFDEIEQKYCSGFEYFLENFIVQDMINDISEAKEFKNNDKKVERIIHYAEFNA